MCRFSQFVLILDSVAHIQLDRTNTWSIVQCPALPAWLRFQAWADKLDHETGLRAHEMRNGFSRYAAALPLASDTTSEARTRADALDTSRAYTGAHKGVDAEASF